MSDLPAVKAPEPPQPVTLVCANCGAGLHGEYCAACGQRHEPHVHTVGHFVSEAFESISHADSRLWRTLGYLLTRPGFLTGEFFAGRRVAYLPPFRLYLVLSVVFFLVTGLPSGEPGYVSALSRDGTARVDPVVTGDAVKAAREAATAEPGFNVDIESGLFNDFCKPFDKPETGESGESGASTRRNVRAFCNKVRNDSSELGAAVLHNLPRAMFVFLPLLALIMKAMYWRPKRYYVEHLLFLVHNHAFVFLAFSIVSLLSLLLERYIGQHVGWFYLGGFLYSMWYLFRAMRTVYGQIWSLTAIKYILLGFSYMISAVVVLLFTLIFTAIAGS